MRRRKPARGAEQDFEPAIAAAAALVVDPAARVVVAGQAESVRRLLDGDGQGAGPAPVAEVVPLGHAVVALLSRRDDAAAAALARPLRAGSLRVVELRGDAPTVLERPAPGAPAGG